MGKKKGKKGGGGGGGAEGGDGGQPEKPAPAQQKVNQPPMVEQVGEPVGHQQRGPQKQQYQHGGRGRGHHHQGDQQSQKQGGPPSQQFQYQKGPPSQQQGGPSFQQQAGPPYQQVQQQRGPPSQQQGGPSSQQQGGPPSQQRGRGRGQHHQQGGPPRPQYQQQGEPTPQQYPQQTGPPPQQFQQQRGPPPQQYQQQSWPPPQQYQQQRGPPPQQYQQQSGPPPQQYQQQSGPPPQVGRGQPQQQGGRGYPQQQGGRGRAQQQGGRGQPQQQGQPQYQQQGGRGQPQQQGQPQYQQQGSRPPSQQYEQQGVRGQSQQQAPLAQSSAPPSRHHSSSSGDSTPKSPTSSSSGGASQVRSSPNGSQVRISPTGGGGGVTYRIPARKTKGPTVGTLGRATIVETNYLALNIKKNNKIVHHYDVSIRPDKPFRMYRKIMQAFQRKVYPDRYPAFDGRKNLYSSAPLPHNGELIETLMVWDDEKGKEEEYTVETKFAAFVDMSTLGTYMQQGSSTGPPQDAIQALDIALRHPAALSCVQVGRSFFSQPERGRVVALGEGLDLWYGIFQSAVLGWKPFLNIDVAHKGFPQPVSCLEMLCNILECPRERLPKGPLDGITLNNIRNYIKGLKIEYELPGLPSSKRTYKVDDIQSNAVDYRFDFQERNITVGEYFSKEKGYNIKYPYLPLVICCNKRNAFPIELCRIKSGQVTMKKLTDGQTREMVRAAATPADVRKSKILDAMRKVGFKDDNCVKEFGIEVSEQFEKVRARVLEPPTLEYNRQKNVFVSKGVWRPARFVMSCQIERWGILNLNYRTQDSALHTLEQMFREKGEQLGMCLHKAQFAETMQFRRNEDITNKLKERLMNCKRNDIQLVVVVISDGGDIYGKVKKIAEVDVGILTQCLKGKTVFNLKDTTVSNILLKVNAKMNGINHTISQNSWPKYFSNPVMVVGADVTHPSPDQKDIPSIAAVAASHDPRAFKYNMVWQLQQPRVEIIEGFDDIMQKQLMFFYRQTKQKPSAILFFRDGVSEGQFGQVLSTELTAMRRACCNLEKEYQPKITFLVVQKRHHTRFFPTRREDEDGKNRNVPAGTIVDTDITHPTELDFYLVSHASIQGTSRPTKYHLLWDDADLSEDTLEQITYYLCHLFTRCTRSVSYPAPTYYAHLAASRIRNYFDGRLNVNLNNLPMEQSLKTIKDEIATKSPMFFV